MPSADRSRPRWGLTLGIFAAYVALAVALTWPLTPNIATAVPNDLGDPVLNTWILWWNAVTVPLTDAWWNAPAYYPTDGVLTFSEHLLGLSPISTPLYWLTGNIQLGYNVALFLSFPLSAFFGYLLCRDLTGRRDAAFIGGLIFGFAPYRIVQLPHIQVLCSYWMPITLLGLHRYIRDERPRWLVVFGLGWLMQALCNGYFLAFLSVLVGLWILWFVPWRRWRMLLNIGVAWIVAALPVVPIVLKYREVHGALGLRRSVDEMLLYSADMTSFMDHASRLVVWRFLPAFHRPEGELFPGIAGVILVIAGLWISRGSASTSHERPQSRGLRRLRRGLTIATLFFLAGAVSAAVAPWAFVIGPMTVSATHMHKPLSLALYFAIALLFTSPRVRRSTAGRTVLGFYVLAAAAMWLLSFGPKPTFMGIQALYEGPYAWLIQLPGLDTLRTPARFHMVAMLCLSCAAAICFGRIAARVRRPALLTGVFIVLVMSDTWIHGFPIEPAPKPWPVQQHLQPGPVLELPFGRVVNDVEGMYRAMFTGNPVVNGYSGYAPPWYGAVSQGLLLHDSAVFSELSARGVRQVVLDMQTDESAGWKQYFDGRSDVQLVHDDGAHRLYRLPESTQPPLRQFGRPLSIAGITANVRQTRIPEMTDGDLKTRWETGPQRGMEEVTIDLGTAAPVGALVLSLGPFSADPPRDLLLEVSPDGSAWTQTWRGSTAGQTFRAVFDDPIRIPLIFDLGDRTARFIRLRQLGEDKVFYWTIAELSVLAPPGR